MSELDDDKQEILNKLVTIRVILNRALETKTSKEDWLGLGIEVANAAIEDVENLKPGL